EALPEEKTKSLFSITELPSSSFRFPCTSGGQFHQKTCSINHQIPHQPSERGRNFYDQHWCPHHAFRGSHISAPIEGKCMHSEYALGY
ncbi:AAEL010282-PA, partial [Aedes aegypti]